MTGQTLHPSVLPLPQVFARWGQFAVVGFIVMALSFMILPMSSFLLDIMLAFNLAGSLAILIVSLSIAHPLQFSSFPSLLLMTTLMRLCLNISSTRLILSQAQGGAIIQTFGQIVAGGHLLVGIVIFLTLMMIQFVVVSKGSERVAEVAARFTLDALPGKQMSIDADLRAGLLSSDTAAEKRKTLIHESRFYGAMDGAMKFVKGDAIAGFIIVFINILGGVAMGVFSHDLDFSSSLRRYTLLTVGDGLVAQIPSLLMALSSGFLITRVAHENSDSSLGDDLGRQIASNDRVMITVGIVMLLIGFVPGFPLFPFVTIASGLFLVAGVLIRRQKNAREKDLSLGQFYIDPLGSDSSPQKVHPLVLELHPDACKKFMDGTYWQECFHVLFPRVRTHLSDRLGVVFPELKMAVNQALPATHYVIKIHDVPVERGFLDPDHCVVKGISHRVTNLRAKTAATVHGTPVHLYPVEQRNELLARGMKCLLPEEVLLTHLMRVLRRHAHEFVGIQQVKDRLNSLERECPDLVREVVPRMISTAKLTEVMRRLAEEGVPMRDLRLILEILAQARPESKNSVAVTEMVRMGLKRVITHLHLGEDGRLHCFGLDPLIEEKIEQAVQKDDDECYLNLSAQARDEIVAAIQSAYKSHNVPPRRVVLLTHQTVRRYLRKLMETALPDVSVLSYQELEPAVVIAQRDTISLLEPI